ncbi:winged helix-turn-helix transcriptional regulator [Candidatus Parcubacteria bacterium]|nr:winged helix-turn-helix transcriptional regulator [Candidatus Parcubacteria bacterium]
MKTKTVEKILKPFASKRRLDIVKVLKETESAPVWYISEKIDLSYFATSKHCLSLEKLGIIESEYHGKENHYYLPTQKSKLAKYIVSLL